MNAPPARPLASPRFGLALGGGGARGLAHIHVIEALDELGIRPAVIAGSSIGAIMGAGMAAGMTGADIRDYAMRVLNSREVAARMWRARPETFGAMVRGGLHVTQFDALRIVTAFLPEQVPQSFDGLSIPLKVTATDYYGHRMTVFSEGDLHSALAASAAIPAVFRPVRRDGRVYIDGGIYNPVPFDLIRHEVDIVIAVDVVGAPEENGARKPNAIDLMFGATQLMMQSIIAGKLAQGRPDILLRPPVSRYRVLDFLRAETILSDTADVKDELKRAVEAALAVRVA